MITTATLSDGANEVIKDIAPLLQYYFDKYKIMDQKDSVGISVDDSDGVILSRLMQAKVKNFHVIKEIYTWFGMPSEWIYTGQFFNNFSLTVFWNAYRDHKKGSFLIIKILEDVKKL